MSVAELSVAELSDTDTDPKPKTYLPFLSSTAKDYLFGLDFD